MPRLEKFRHGDVVRIAKNLGSSMEHFTGKGTRAVVLGSYRDLYGGSGESNTKKYSLFIEGQGKCSWYYESQLTFIEHNPALMDTWEDQIAARQRDESDLKWIKKNWKTLRGQCSSTTILALFDAFGYQSSFSRNGEYYCLWEDWVRMFPIIDTTIKCRSLKALRALQKSSASPEIVNAVESFWKKVHENNP